MFNRPKFPQSQPTISINNLPGIEELSEEEASKIAGGSNPRPISGGGDPHGLNEPENQVSSISLRGIGMNHNTTMVTTAELKSDSLSSENLDPFEELFQEEARAIAGGGINLVFNQPENQIPSIFRSGIRINHNTTVVTITELNTLGSSS